MSTTGDITRADAETSPGTGGVRRMISAQAGKSLLIRGAIMFVLVGIGLAVATALSIANGWSVVDTCRWSAVGIMVMLAVFILSPLTGVGLADRSRTARWNAYAVYWFTVSTIFNLVWQVPLTLFRGAITTAERSHDNLPIYIAWWGYGFADSHYGEVDAWMRSEELWWLLAVVLAVAGLVLANRGRGALGYLLMGIGGILQCYNASLYIVYDVVAGMPNIHLKDGLSYALYWGFNPLWAGCSLLAGYWCLTRVYSAASKGWNR